MRDKNAQGMKYLPQLEAIHAPDAPVRKTLSAMCAENTPHKATSQADTGPAPSSSRALAAHR